MEELQIRLNNLRRLVAVAKTVGAPKRAVAERLGVDSSRFSQLCGPTPIRQIHETTAHAFEKLLDRPKRWLDIERTEEELLDAWLAKPIPLRAEYPRAIYASTPNIEAAPPLKGMVPLISWVSAGYFCEVIDNFHPGDAEEWISTTVAVSPNSYALRVRGDSMEPDFPEGSIIIVDPRREPQPGNYVIAKNGGEATFKQLTKDGADRYLKPLNPQYPIKLIDEHMIICGVVVSMERKLV